jgi:hypothetical protein
VIIQNNPLLKYSFLSIIISLLILFRHNIILTPFNYPRYPKGQAYVERMNRILQDEFVIYYEGCELKDVYEFNKKEMEVHIMVQHRKVSS